MYYILYFEDKMSQVSMLQQKSFFLNTENNVYVKYYWVELKFS